jgi:hypothetical protein
MVQKRDSLLEDAWEESHEVGWGKTLVESLSDSLPTLVLTKKYRY